MLRRCMVLALLAAAAGLSCHQAILTAPPGSTMVVRANPGSIPAYGGVSVISALVIEPAGTPVPDGTVVQFFTDLGTIDEQGKTNDGVARVNLVSDSRSGTATVTAYSGGGAGAVATPDETTEHIARALSAAIDGASGQVEVKIGAATVDNVQVSAQPGRIVYPERVSEITASVFDDAGNPVARVPILFDAFENEAGDPAKYEELDSAGVPVFTDNNGRAHDRLTTRYSPTGRVRWVRVVATPPVGEGGETTVQIN